MCRGASLGLLDVTRTGAKTAEAWSNDYSARLAANSVKEMAYLKLKTDGSYLGENLTLPDDAGSANVVVTTPYPSGRSVKCHGTFDTAHYEFTVDVNLVPRHLRYSLAVCDDLDLMNDSKNHADDMIKISDEERKKLEAEDDEARKIKNGIDSGSPTPADIFDKEIKNG